MNSYLHRNSDAAFYVKFLFTLMIDVMIVAVMIHWVCACLSWKFAANTGLFFSIRFVLTRLISYRNVEGSFWPESSFLSLSNSGLTEQQYQVSGYSGILLLILLYWHEQGRPR